MKKIEIFVGSPRRNGNTAYMTELLEREAETAGAEVSVTYLYDIDIAACIDCRRCTKGDLLCPVADDMQELYGRLDAADVIVIGSPVYWYGPTAVAKMMLDRLRPYYRNRGLEGKVLALLTPAADGSGDCDLIEEMFRRSAGILGMDYRGSVKAEAFDIGDLKGNREIESAVSELAMSLMS